MKIKLTYDHALKLIQDSCDSLQKANLLESKIEIRDDTVILGSGSPFDSIAFVVFVTELEDRLNKLEQQDDLSLVLKDIHEYNTGNSALTAGVLGHYLIRLTGGQV